MSCHAHARSRGTARRKTCFAVRMLSVVLVLLLVADPGSDPNLAKLEALGPISMGKDGSLNRIVGWDAMTTVERETATRLISARNAKRKRALLEKERSQEEKAHSHGWPFRHITNFLRRLVKFWRQPRVTPDIDFAPEFVAAIANGTKRATTRYIARDGEPTLAALRVHDIVCAMCRHCDDEAAQKGFALLSITRIERTRCGRLNDTLAGTEGFTTADDLRAALRRFYPSLRARDRLIVVHFDVTEQLSLLAGRRARTEWADARCKGRSNHTQ